MFIELLKGTPWWVYLLFFYLLVVGIKALKPHVISLKKLFMIPFILTIWGLYDLMGRLATITDLAIWVVFVIIGCNIGWLWLRRTHIEADKKKALVRRPGGLSLLVLLLLIFVGKYFFNAFRAVNPIAYEAHSLILFDLGFSGLITGIFIGRTLQYWKKYKSAPHTDLVEK